MSRDIICVCAFSCVLCWFGKDVIGCWPFGVLCVFFLLPMTERPRCVVVAVTISLHDLVVSFFAMNRWGVCIFVCSVSVYKVPPIDI